MMRFNERVVIWTEALEVCQCNTVLKESWIQPLDLRACRGEAIRIEGLGNRQKKAFMEVMGCMKMPHRGKYVLDYEDVCLMDKGSLPVLRNKKIGFMLKSDHLIDELTVSENVQMPLLPLSLGHIQNKIQAAAVLERTGIEKRGDVAVSKLNAMERRQVSLARAIVKQPVMLFADEPFYGLDTVEAQKMAGLLSSLQKDGMVLLLFSEAYCIEPHRVLRFKNGVLAENRYTSDEEEAAKWA